MGFIALCRSARTCTALHRVPAHLRVRFFQQDFVPREPNKPAAEKIKVIKEIRGFTDLGLKEAKELVEKAPVSLKQGITKDEASCIIEKIKVAGGVAVMQ